METLLTLATVLCTDTQPGCPLCSGSSNTGIPALVCPSSPQQLPLINLILDQLQPNMKRSNSPPLPPLNIFLSDYESVSYTVAIQQLNRGPFQYCVLSVLKLLVSGSTGEWKKREKNSQIHSPVLAQTHLGVTL